ncbi:Coenzyme F420 hydrogenase/dehydrogenase, beta subunit C-terminal domain [Mycolicibacterium pyrenivorans]|uniref:Coenzyme F420 hydrogenase/dehydrogenase, beta subunit C-terminal domain n=1 Tax=Mycolicibacterium pyrenivorans TaxID=187102 RepID=UPI0021F397E1|nr:Coenzyme F420 hydrogenase/dehydrogenase, beta subunit C-terminal domain [Mycolicibacterium pyrenivorans]MCV7151161.1 Coenzyme F420 hydrogenase/dehydrogenase, beta subunit C-terminal domain [Mycolicibacterium pyrenivorans]
MKRERTGSKLEREVQRVLANDNCTGCGVCALISDRITVNLDSQGFCRPTVNGSESRDKDESEATTFTRVCPGVSLHAPSPEGKRRHPVFGSYVEAWQGWAVDPEFRHAGSSGGVLTALSCWLMSSGRAREVAGCGMSAIQPTRTVPLRITSREEALAAAGSRYAPVSNSLSGQNCEAFIGKPCEVSGRRRLASNTASAHGQSPVLLSFFCAGTPSQHATEDLARALGAEPSDVTSLRYRGDGWPGEFEVRTIDGAVRTMSYEDSWGKNLGRRLPLRCKLCADGTGEDADIAVGDFWATDAKGYPAFDNADGNSVIIARTQRGAELLLAAADQRILTLNPVNLESVAAVQPLQAERRRTLAGRLAGRRLAGYRVPRYRGYNLLQQLALHSAANLRAAAGTFSRSTGLRK